MTIPWAPDPVQARVAELSMKVPVNDPARLAQLLELSSRTSAERFEVSANLYAGGNVLSSRAQRLISPALGGRPTLGSPGDKFPAGVEDIDLIEVAATKAVRVAMHARFADVRPPSATVANLAVFTAMTAPGDTIAALPEAAGGHVSHRSGAPLVRGLRVVTLPYDYETLDVDLGRLREFLDVEEPKLVIIGASLMLRPHRLKDIADTAHEVGALVVYDASHVAGLIAGGCFQQPLDDGADILTFSTYKSFGGPAGGALCTNDPGIAERLHHAIYPMLTANYDVGRLAPLAVTASELISGGHEYANSCIANARSLGAALATDGLTVVGETFHYTESHQLAVDASEYGGGGRASRMLADAGIFVSPAILPCSDAEVEERGFRVGTQELTRRGLNASHMSRLANLIGAVLRREIDPAGARTAVAELVRKS